MLLNELPFIVLLEVACYLDPVSVISLSQCCRSLYDVTHSHLVWSSVLMNTIREHRAFVPSFPTEQMPIEELKAASTRPLRMQSALWDQSTVYGESPVLTPAMTRRLLPHAVTNPAFPNTTFWDFAIIPGGRFLITTDRALRICLWDIGDKSTGFLDRKPLAIKQFQGPNVFTGEWLIQPTDDGQGVVIAVILAQSVDDYLDEIHILELYPAADCPEFSTLGVRHVHPEEDFKPNCHNLSSRFFGYHIEEYFVFWEYRKDLRSYLAFEGVSDFLIYDNVVLVFRDTSAEYAIVTIPEPTTKFVLRNVEPMLHARFPVHYMSYSMPPAWYISDYSNKSSGQNDVHLDILGTSNGRGRTLHYVLTHISSNHPCAPPLLLVRTHDIRNDLVTTSQHNLSTIVTPDGTRWLIWEDEFHVWITLSRGPPIIGGVYHEGESINRKLFKWEEGEANWDFRYQSFCPFSGRLCVMGLSGEIKILDFVK